MALEDILTAIRVVAAGDAITAYQAGLLDTQGSQVDHLIIRSAPVIAHCQQ
jgi:hypothetical protein